MKTPKPKPITTAEDLAFVLSLADIESGTTNIDILEQLTIAMRVRCEQLNTTKANLVAVSAEVAQLRQERDALTLRVMELESAHISLVQTSDDWKLSLETANEAEGLTLGRLAALAAALEGLKQHVKERAGHWEFVAKQNPGDAAYAVDTLREISQRLAALRTPEAKP